MNWKKLCRPRNSFDYATVLYITDGLYVPQENLGVKIVEYARGVKAPEKYDFLINLSMKINRGIEPRFIFAVCSSNAVNENKSDIKPRFILPFALQTQLMKINQASNPALFLLFALQTQLMKINQASSPALFLSSTHNALIKKAKDFKILSFF